MSHHVRFLSAADIRSALTIKTAVELMRQAFSDLSVGDVVSPMRTHLPVTDGGALVMPAYRGTDEALVVKIATVHQNPSSNRSSSVNATIVLLDAETCRPSAIMDGTLLTAVRTGAASGVATDVLARRDANVAAVVGTGGQAYFQVAGMISVRPVSKVVIVAKEMDSAEALAGRIESTLGVRAEVVDLLSRLRDVDMIATATNAREPFLGLDHVSPGVHINAIGSHRPEMSEIQAELVGRSRLVVDQREACLNEAGDVLKPIADATLSADHIHAELGEIISGSKKGRSDEYEITIFKSVGVAAQDLAVASFVLQRAIELNLGTAVPMETV